MKRTNALKTIHGTAECQGKLSSVGDALYALGGKWRLRIIIALQDGSKRFNDLQRTITGISARVLSNELKELELHGFVRRRVYDQTPVVIEYELMPYCDSLKEVVTALSNWGALHRDKIKRDIKKEQSRKAG